MADDLDGLCCPLTLEAFVDPVILAGDGHTYERSAVTQWLGTGKLTFVLKVVEHLGKTADGNTVPHLPGLGG